MKFHCYIKEATKQIKITSHNYIETSNSVEKNQPQERKDTNCKNLMPCLNWGGREGEYSRISQKLGIISNSSHLLCRTYTYNFCYINIHGSEDYIIHVITSFYKLGYVDPLTNLNSYCHFSDMSTKRPRYTKHISA